MAFLLFSALVSVSASAGSALTVRTKADLLYWETVTDPSMPLSWPWKDSADSARLSFSNRMTRAVSSLVVNRESGETHGCCSHPALPEADAALVIVTLAQYAGGVEISRETAELAYVPGAAGRALTVRAKSDREWHRVKRPRIAAYDASWWNLPGPSGYEIVWSQKCGPRRYVRAFDGFGVVDETELLFIDPYFMLMIR